MSLEVNENKTILAIIPFLGGRYGLNSDVLLQEFGKRIRDLCKQKFGEVATANQVICDALCSMFLIVCGCHSLPTGL